MPIYTGKSADGSDMRLAEGVYVNPNNPNEWSSEMYPSQKRTHRHNFRVRNYMAKNLLSYNDVRNEILNKKCRLSKYDRSRIMSEYYGELWF